MVTHNVNGSAKGKRQTDARENLKQNEMHVYFLIILNFVKSRKGFSKGTNKQVEAGVARSICGNQSMESTHAR